MPYVKLTSRLRRMIDDIDRQMRLSGYKADLRWLELSHGMCPLCGEYNRPATISIVQVPAYSGRIRPLIPVESVRLLRLKSTTRSDGTRPLIPVQIDHL
jgi:hypothetical protein